MKYKLYLCFIFISIFWLITIDFNAEANSNVNAYDTASFIEII